MQIRTNVRIQSIAGKLAEQEEAMRHGFEKIESLFMSLTDEEKQKAIERFLLLLSETCEDANG